MKLIRLLIAISFACLFSSCEKADKSEIWPRKSVKVIIPFKPGGSTDQIVRVLQKSIKDNNLMKKNLTVINVEGHWSVGCNKVRFAKPDGYTFLAMHKALMGGKETGINDFDHTDFTPVAEVTSFAVILAVRDDAPWKTLDELLEDAKKRPNEIRFGCNIGALNHMAGVAIQNSKPGAAFNFIQIGGGSANFDKMLGNHVDVSVFSTSEYLSFRSEGLNGLAFTGSERHPAINDIPTLKELGVDFSFSVGSWWFAPKGTPQEAIDGLTEVLEAAMQVEYSKQQFENRAMTPSFYKGKEFDDKLIVEHAQVIDICKSINVSKNFDPLGAMAIPWAVFIGVIVLLIIIGFQSLAARKKAAVASANEPPKTDDAVVVVPQYKLTLYFFALTIAYILIMSTGFIRFSIITIIYTTAAIGLLGRFNKKLMIFAIIIAIIMGFGCEYLFTEVFDVDLPTGGN